MWHDRIEAVKTGGLHSIADAVMQRWFGRDMLRSPDLPRWRKMLTDTPKEGYMGACAAIAGTDFYTPTSGLRLPTLGIAGSEDGAMPPDMVRETTELIPGSQFHLIRRAGHLPCVDAPEEYAATLTKFMRDIGHIPAA
jgi:3-oxoadipate enol-lactonase